MSLFKQYLTESEIRSTRPVKDDSFDLMINETLCIESVVLEDSDEEIVIQGDERVFEILESLGMLEASDRMLRKRDMDFLVHVRDNYYVNVMQHRDDDNYYETYDLVQKVKDVDDQMTPAYKDLGIIHELPARRASEAEIKQAADLMIAELGGVEEPTAPDQPPMDQEVQPGTPDQMAEMRRLAGLSAVEEAHSSAQQAATAISMKNAGKKPKHKEEEIEEADYHGRSVTLGKPTTGDVKKFKVYVRDPKSGNIKKVNFGDPNMEIKRDNPERRKNFRARHNCADKKDRTKAGYWSCRMWSKKPVSKIV